MTLIEQFNAFCEASKGKLTLPERGLYMTLLDIWNRIPGRPEWFDVSIPQVMKEAKVGSNRTVIKNRESLEEKGFIKTVHQGRGKMLRVKLVRFATSAKNALPNAETALPNDKKKGDGSAKNALPPMQKVHYHQCNNCTTPNAESELGVVQKMHPSKRESFKEYTESLSKVGTTNKVDTASEVHNPPEREIPHLPDDVLEKYSTYSLKISKREKETLAVWSEEYGTRAVKNAIDKGIQSGGKSINYIGEILRNGEKNGQRKNGQRNNAYGRSYPHEISEDPSKWARAEETLITDYGDFFGPEDEIHSG